MNAPSKEQEITDAAKRKVAISFQKRLRNVPRLGLVPIPAADWPSCAGLIDFKAARSSLLRVSRDFCGLGVLPHKR